MGLLRDAMDDNNYARQ